MLKIIRNLISGAILLCLVGVLLFSVEGRNKIIDIKNEAVLNNIQSSLKENYDYENKNGDVGFFFNKKRTNDEFVKIEKEDFSIGFSPDSPNGNFLTDLFYSPVVTGNKIMYENVYDDTNIEYETKYDSLKETIIVNKKVKNRYVFNVDIEDGTEYIVEGNEVMFYVNGVPKGKIRMPYAVDSADKYYAVTASFEKKGNSHQYILDTSSIVNPTYPIYIDPTYDDFNDNTVNTSLWTTLAKSAGTVTETGGQLQMYAQGNSYPDPVSMGRSVSVKDFSDVQNITFYAYMYCNGCAGDEGNSSFGIANTSNTSKYKDFYYIDCFSNGACPSGGQITTKPMSKYVIKMYNGENKFAFYNSTSFIKNVSFSGYASLSLGFSSQMVGGAYQPPGTQVYTTVDNISYFGESASILEIDWLNYPIRIDSGHGGDSGRIILNGSTTNVSDINFTWRYSFPTSQNCTLQSNNGTSWAIANSCSSCVNNTNLSFNYNNPYQGLVKFRINCTNGTTLIHGDLDYKYVNVSSTPPIASVIRNITISQSTPNTIIKTVPINTSHIFTITLNDTVEKSLDVCSAYGNWTGAYVKNKDLILHWNGLEAYYTTDSSNGIEPYEHQYNINALGSMGKTTGYVSNAYAFDGAGTGKNTFLNITNTDITSLFTRNKPFTISLWAKGNKRNQVCAPGGSACHLFTTWHNTTEQFQMYWVAGTTDYRAYANFYNQTVESKAVRSGDLSLGTDWHNMVYINYNTTHGKFYVDNVERITVHTSEITSILDKSATIGGVKTNTRFFNGTIDEIAIFSRALNSTEKDLLYASTREAILDIGQPESFYPNTNATDGSYKWSVECNLTTGERSGITNTTYQVDRANSPLRNLTLIRPRNYTVDNSNLSAHYKVTDLDENITCWFGLGNIVSYPLSGVDTTVNYNFATEGDYVWNVSCNSTTDANITTSENWHYIYDVTAPIFINQSTDENTTYPQIGDALHLSIVPQDNFALHYCTLYIDDLNGYTNRGDYGFNEIAYDAYNCVNITNCGNAVDRNWDTYATYAYVNMNSYIYYNYTVIQPSQISYRVKTNSVDAQTNISCRINSVWTNIGRYNDGIAETIFDIPEACVVGNKIQLRNNLRFNNLGEGTQRLYEGILYHAYRNTSKRINFTYDIQTYSTLNNSNLTWYINCLDVAGNTANSGIDTVEVKDTIPPVIGFGNGNGFTNNSVISKRYGSIPINITFFDYNLDRVLINVTCDISNQIYFFSASNLTTPYYSKADSIGISSYPLQRCRSFLYSSNPSHNIHNITYYFYIGGDINVTAMNLYDNGILSDFYVDVTSLTALPYIARSYHITGYSGLIENLTNGTYLLSYNKTNFFPKAKTVAVGNTAQSSSYNTYQAALYITLEPATFSSPLSGGSINVTNLNQKSSFIYPTTLSPALFILNASSYTINSKAPPYQPDTRLYNVSALSNASLTIRMGVNASFYFLDEKTLTAFNMSSPNDMKAVIFCETNVTLQYTVTTNPFYMPIGCFYEKIRFVLYFGSVNYQRTFIIPERQTGAILNASSFSLDNVSIYLINARNTAYVSTNIQFDDLMVDYDNPSIYVKRIINTNKEQILADYVDAENKITAFLIQYQEYIIEVHSDNKPVKIIGNFAPDTSTEKTLRVYDVVSYPQHSGYSSSVSYAMYIRNFTGKKTAIATYTDTESKTNSVTWELWRDGFNGTLIYSNTTTAQSFIYSHDVTAYENVTLLGRLRIDREGGSEHTPEKIFWLGSGFTGVRTEIQNLLVFLPDGFMNWFITILLFVIALSTTIVTANKTALLIVGGAALFVTLGLYTISWAVIGIALVMGIGAILREGAK